MWGEDERPGSLFSDVDLEARIDQNHPLRMIRMVVNEALAALAGDFSALYSRTGRPSIGPEKLLRAMLLQAFYSIRSERQLMERLEFDDPHLRRQDPNWMQISPAAGSLFHKKQHPSDR